MTALQLDDLNPMAATLVPYLLGAGDLGSAYFRDGQDLLRDWDFTAGRRQRGSGLLQRGVVQPAPADLPRRAARVAVARRRRPLVRGGDPAAGPPRRLVVGRPRPPTTWSRPATTSCARRMRDARDELTRRQSLDPDDWTWGGCTGSTCASGTLGESGVGLVEGCSTATAIRSRAAAASSTPPRGTPPRATSVTAAPSMRMVVSLADFDDSRWVNLTGVSGHPASATTSTRPTSSSPARRCRGPGRGEAVTTAGTRTRSPCVPPEEPARSRMTPVGGGGMGHRAVVRLDRHVDADLVVVQQHAGERADRHPGQRPVVAAAARPSRTPAGDDRQPGHQHDVGGGDGVDAERRAGRLEQPEPRRGQRRGPVVGAPSRGRASGSTAPAAAPACRRRASRVEQQRRCRARCPTETYAATVAARRTSGWASSVLGDRAPRPAPPRPDARRRPRRSASRSRTAVFADAGL